VELEHSPNPQVSRGVYGFVILLAMVLFIAVYFLWILLPESVTSTWTYEPPQKYWAFAVPIFFCTSLFLFTFCIYPAMHSLHDGKLNELSAVEDSFTVRSTRAGIQIPVFDDEMEEVVPRRSSRKRGRKTESTIKFKLYDDENTTLYPPREIPPAADLDLDQVCKLLYQTSRKEMNS